MLEITAVWVIVAHFTVMGYGGDALPRGKRLAFTSIEDCRRAVPAIERSFAAAGLPISPDKVTCEKLEIRK